MRSALYDPPLMCKAAKAALLTSVLDGLLRDAWWRRHGQLSFQSVSPGVALSPWQASAFASEHAPCSPACSLQAVVVCALAAASDTLWCCRCHTLPAWHPCFADWTLGMQQLSLQWSLPQKLCSCHHTQPADCSEGAPCTPFSWMLCLTGADAACSSHRPCAGCCPQRAHQALCGAGCQYEVPASCQAHAEAAMLPSFLRGETIAGALRMLHWRYACAWLLAMSSQQPHPT